MEIRETPFVLIARVMVKSGKVEEYMKIASTVDEAVEKTEPGMLFHHFDSDPANELKFVWTEIYKNDEALIFHINNPPVGEYVEKHLELAESIEIEIYGQLADETSQPASRPPTSMQMSREIGLVYGHPFLRAYSVCAANGFEVME